MRDRGGGDRAADRLQRRAERAGDPAGHGGDRVGGEGHAEQLGQDLAGPVAGQEVPVPQVRPDRGQPRPVLHRRGHPGRRRRAGHGPAAAAAGDELVLSHHRPGRRHVGHLPAYHPGQPGAGQAVPARRALLRLVRDYLVRRGREFQRRARLSLRPARLAAALAAQRPRRRLGRPVLRRRLRGVPRVLPDPGAQLGDLRRQRRHLPPQHVQLRLMRCPQRRDLDILGLGHPAQPRIRSTQRRDLIADRRDIRHNPHQTIASAM